MQCVRNWRRWKAGRTSTNHCQRCLWLQRPRTFFIVGASDFGNGRNALRGPGFFNTDLSVLKNFKFGERFGFAVGATAFDILNHQNFDLPINSIRSPAFSQILSTIGTNTNPYGAFFGVPLNGRILQVNAKMSF
jgi:hypothetical protein